MDDGQGHDTVNLAQFLGAVENTGLAMLPQWVDSVNIDERINAAGSSWVYDAYQNRDTTAIKKEMPNAWTILCAMQRTLRPFLERHGYTDLLWWK